MSDQKPLELVQISPPPQEQRARRMAAFAAEGEKKGRYHLPRKLESPSVVGYRTRVSLTPEESASVLPLLSLERPTKFVKAAAPIRERELFEELSLGVLSSRQSTNYRGLREIVLGPEQSSRIVPILRRLHRADAPALDHATHTHIVLRRPYRTPFTFLLTFIGHRPLLSLGTVPYRAWDKKFRHADDIPTINYLTHLHVGILADAMERAALIASRGRRKAQVFMAPFCGEAVEENATTIRELERLVGLSTADRAAGWRIALVTQVGEVDEAEQMADVERETWRKLGANLMAFRSERIQPGVNAEERAPEQYQHRQEMDVPDELTVQCGRALYNAFVHWTGAERERSKELCLLERVDVLTAGGKERLREVRRDLDSVTDNVMGGIPLWADLPTGKALSRNASRGKKAFALAGQRIYIGGLDRKGLAQDGIDWDLAVRGFGAAAARSALFAELMGATAVPDDCDLLAGICLMAGPVNQNDIGKSFYGGQDMLKKAFPDHDPTSLLVWTLKAKTVADPIGNEEQLLDAERKGALVDLRPGPADVVELDRGHRREPYRPSNAERAFWDIGNFVVDPENREIPGNRGTPAPEELANSFVWE